jgi:HTH-type transcriptional regulator / antitoxin HigA
MGANPRPARVPSPGRIIRRELDARGWTQKDLAHIMDRPEQFISQIVNAHKRITPETALQLAAAFGTSADLWLNLEARYQLHQARQKEESQDVIRKSKLYSRIPISELRKRGWIKFDNSVEALEREVCAFLEIDNPNESPELAVSLRQSQIDTPEITAEIAWLKRVERLARAQMVENFNRARLKAAIPSLLEHSTKVQQVVEIPVLLLDLGVHFVIVRHLPKTYIDGAAFFMNGQPVVALTLRYDRIDNFWFTLMHELAHIVAGHEGGYLDNLDEPAESPEEKEANRLAQDWLIMPQDLAHFIKTTRPYFSYDKIVSFAARQNRHPGIVVGRLHHDNVIDYGHSRRFLVKVSSYMDEWIDVSEPA